MSTPVNHSVRPLMPLWAALVAAVLASLILNAAYPPVGFWFGAFVAPALLLSALIGRRLGSALLVGLVFGLLFFGVLVSWTSRYLGVIPWAALAGLEGALTAVLVVPITLAYRWFPRAAWSVAARVLALPALIAGLWCVRELVLGSFPYSGFPWARIGMTQSESPVGDLASWLGITGLGFAMVWFVALLLELGRLRLWRRPGWVVVPIAAALVGFLLPAFPTTPAGTFTIGAVQGNGPSGYFDDRAPYAIVNAQTQASEPLYGSEMDLLVWPEGLDSSPLNDAAMARRLSLVSTRVQAPVLVNAATERGAQFYNRSILWGADGATGQSHDKRYPVPFGEYVPDRAFYEAIVPDLIGLIGREYTHGTDEPVMTVDSATIGLAICFDVIYDEVIQEGIRGGAEVLVFQTNNADFRGTSENLQQLAFAKMRARETGRAVVNVSTVGTSQFIAPDGTTVESLDADTAGAMRQTVELRAGTTPAVIVAPLLEASVFWGSLAVLIACGVGSLRRRP